MIGRILLAAAVVFAALPLGAVPVASAAPSIPLQPLETLAPISPPEVTAEAWLLWDETFDRELGGLAPDQPRAMASTTKMMTAIVALANSELDELVVVSEEAADVGESEIDLVPGEIWTMQDLLRALLMRSANDAAIAIAEHVGGSVEGFVAMMNEAASDLNLTNTRFANPHGLDEDGHFSSARDLLTIAVSGMKDPVFADMVATRSATFPDDPDGGERVASSTNALLSTFEGAFGVKTGFTNNAGLTIVAGAEREGRRIYAVVMGSQDHFADSASLLRYGFEAFGLLNVVARGQVLGVQRGPAGLTDLIAEGDVEMFGSTGTDVDVVLEQEDGAPLAVVEVDDGEVARSAVSAEAPAPLPGIGDAFAWASAYWDWLWGND